MTKRPLRVIIVGAGLAGLAIAHGLQQSNIDFVIVDRDTGPRDRNWCITMSWSLQLLERLVPKKTFETMNLCQPDPTLDPVEAGKSGILVRDGSTGLIRICHQAPIIWQINHRKTKRHLSEGLAVKYGKRLVNITINPDDDQEVTAHFEDGTSEVGTIIVGADGGASRVRRWLLGDAAVPEVLPCEFMKFSFSLPAESAIWLSKNLNPIAEIATHPRNMYMSMSFLDKPDFAKPETWLFYILAAWKSSNSNDDQDSRSKISILRSRMADWVDPFKSAVEKLPDDIVIKQDQLRIWHPKPWNNYQGRVTLAGDAAHSMTFHRGQGGNLAIRSAYELVNQLVLVHKGEREQKMAIDTYDGGVLLRGEEVEISRQSTMGFLDYKNIEKSPVFNMGISPSVKL